MYMLRKVLQTILESL